MLSSSFPASPGDLPSIELGFAERISPGEDPARIDSHHWPDWDGGKAGGVPAWLHPRLPAPASLACAHCARPLLLLLQLYAPVDAPAVEHAGAFHRMLYVFACRRARCVNRAHAPSVVVLRAQLPRDSALHAGEEVIPFGDDASPTCVLCGLPAPTRCGRCRGPRYCSREPQARPWRAGQNCPKKVNNASLFSRPVRHERDHQSTGRRASDLWN